MNQFPLLEKYAMSKEAAMPAPIAKILGKLKDGVAQGANKIGRSAESGSLSRLSAALTVPR